MMRRRIGRRPSSRGVAAVEAALVFPFVLIITFAVIEFGLIFSTESTSLSSAQAGARKGASELPLAPAPANAFDAIRDEVVRSLGPLSERATPGELWIYRAAADGLPETGVCSSNCVRYSWDGTSFTNPTGTWPAPDACLAGGLDDVGVLMTVNHRLVTGFLFDDVDLDEHTTAQLEPLPVNQCPTS